MVIAVVTLNASNTPGSKKSAGNTHPISATKKYATTIGLTDVTQKTIVSQIENTLTHYSL
jgi:hypothetical protein